MSVIGNAITLGGGAGVGYASGEFEYVSGTKQITHNLGTRRVCCVLQRVNEDHSNIDRPGSSTRYVAISSVFVTNEVVNWDSAQTYSYDGGNQLIIDSDKTAGYPKGAGCYFQSATETGNIPVLPVQSGTGGVAIDDNTISVSSPYSLLPGRWVWSCFAVGGRQ